jgi:hypothetical protein
MRLEGIEPDQLTAGMLLQFEKNNSHCHKRVRCSVLASKNSKPGLHRQKAMDGHENRSNWWYRAHRINNC